MQIELAVVLMAACDGPGVVVAHGIVDGRLAGSVFEGQESGQPHVRQLADTLQGNAPVLLTERGGVDVIDQRG
jgi:hypothetical protein